MKLQGKLKKHVISSFKIMICYNISNILANNVTLNHFKILVINSPENLTEDLHTVYALVV